MQPVPFALDAWRELASFQGDSTDALRQLASHVRSRLPGTGVALVLVRDQKPGTGRLAGLIGPDGTEHFANSDPFGRHGDLPLFDDELAASLLRGDVPHALELGTQERDMPLGQALITPASVLALPQITTGRLDHWLLVCSDEHGRFAGEDSERLWNEFGHAVSLLSRALYLRNAEAQASRSHREIEGLAEIQKLLQPESPPIIGLEYAIHWQPAETAAGDYYDLMQLTQFAEGNYDNSRGDWWGAMIADVSGHGAAAAMESVQFDAILRTYKGDEPPGGPAGALTYANRYFFSRRQRRHFMTVFAATYRPDLRELVYVSAGHPPALLRQGNAVRVLGAGEDGGIPLGILREHRWQNEAIVSDPGDVLVVYTDGIPEARNAQGEMFGEERLRELVRTAAPTPEAIREAVISALVAHQGSALGQDDQTLIALRHAL